MTWRPPRTATPRRTASCRSPPHTACASGGPGTGCRVTGSRSQDREEVKCLVKIARANPEVTLGDRRREAVVEALRQAQPRVNAVPARAQRQLVRSQLARMEDAQQLDRAEDTRAQLAKLLRAVLDQMPWIAGTVGA